MGRPKGSKNKLPYPKRDRSTYLGHNPKYKQLLCLVADMGIKADPADIIRWRNAYYFHKRRAVSYGIGFELTFRDWLGIWYASGKLGERGSHRNEYCMARYFDRGAYSLGNVKIITNTENIAEAWARVEYREQVLSAHRGINLIGGLLWATDGKSEKRVRTLTKGWYWGRKGKTNVG